MTISSQTRTAGPFTGTGLAVSYPFAFKVFTAADLLVLRTDTGGAQSTLVLSADYTVALNADQNAAPGGTITLTTALPAGYSLTATSAIALLQTASLLAGGAFSPAVIENALDRLVILLQQQGFTSGQALRVLDAAGIATLPIAAARASRVLAFDSSGNPITIPGVDSSSAAALAIDLANGALAGKGSGLMAFNGQLNYAVGTIGYREWLSVYVEDYGAVPDWNGTTGTDNAAAINAAIAAVGTVARKGGQVVLTGRYKVLSQVSNPYQGVYLVGKGGRRTAITQIHNANTSGGHAVHFGDPAEVSPDANHIDAQGISGIFITGNASSGCGIRAYNTTLACTDVGVYGHGSYGIYTDTCYLSSFTDCTSQANLSASQFYSKQALNAVTFMRCSFLSAPGRIGVEISPGSKGTNSATFINCDFEGLLWGIYLDCTLGSIKGTTLIETNFESNTGFAIKQSAIGNITGLTIIGGGYYQAGCGISLGAAYGGQITGPTMTDCDIDVVSNNGLYVINPVLQGTAAVHGATVISTVAGNYPNGSVVIGGPARIPLQTRIAGAWMPVEPIMSVAPTVATVGAAAYAMDLSAGNCYMLTLSAAATGLTLTAINDTAPTGAEATIMVYNGGAATAGGAVTIPAGWKKSAALVIPSINTMSTWRFRKDGNGNWWESCRVVNAS